MGDKPTNTSRIRAALQRGDMHHGEIVRHLGLTPKQVTTALTATKLRDMVRFDGLKWGLKCSRETQ